MTITECAHLLLLDIDYVKSWMVAMLENHGHFVGMVAGYEALGEVRRVENES
jgi:hypothetical protein